MPRSPSKDAASTSRRIRGRIESLGPLASGLRALEAVVTVPKPEQSIFDGLDVSIPGLAKLSGLPDGTIRTELAAIDAAAKKALQDYQPLEPSRIVPALGDGIKAMRAARQALSSIDIQEQARARRRLLAGAQRAGFHRGHHSRRRCRRRSIADTETVVAGGRVGVNVRVFLAQPSLASVGSMTVKAPEAWTVREAADRDAQGGRGRREMPNGSARFEVSVPATAAEHAAIFFGTASAGRRYRWPEGSAKGTPFAPSLLIGEVGVKVGDVNLVVSRPVQYRFADPIRGELRRPVNVVPQSDRRSRYPTTHRAAWRQRSAHAAGCCEGDERITGASQWYAATANTSRAGWCHPRTRRLH